MSRFPVRHCFFALLLVAPMLRAQSADVTAPSDLEPRIVELRSKAHNGDGSASVKLDSHSRHLTMLALRTRTGAAEVHSNVADVFVVLRGHARLLSGGVLAAPRDIQANPQQVPAVVGGVEKAVAPGDIIQIPAGIPHQLIIQNGEEFVYYVIKIEEPQS